MQNEKDPELWAIAQRRVGFKQHLITYVGMNCFFWGLYIFTGWRYQHHGFPWPIWPMLGWGFGLVVHYLGAYVFTRVTNVEKEYEKLKRQAEGSK
jgi:hypothetical protein